MPEINARSNYFQVQFARNRLIRDLIKGLEAMRGISTTTALSATKLQESVYLPRFPSEPDDVYKLRVRRSYLTNYFLRAIDSDSGKILAKTIGLKADGSKDLPEEFHPWLDDTDLEGKPFSVLARDQLQEGLAKGVTLAFVDHTEGDRGRPFVREIDIDDVLSFRADDVTGRLTFLRWQDSIPTDTEEDGIVNSNVVFELEPTEWRMFRVDDQDGTLTDEPDEFGEIIRFRNGTQRIVDEIPVSLFYTNKLGKLVADSPYRTLAELTLEHFQVYSDLKNMMFYALQPILQVQNAPDDFDMSALASYLCVKFPQNAEAAQMSWIQVDPGSIEQARKQIEDIQTRIASFSIDNAAIRPGNQTATQSAIDASGANAALRSFAEGLEEHLERILEMMASYTLMPEMDIDVTVSPDFSVRENNEDLKTLIELRKLGDISREALLDAFIERGLLSEEFDKEADLELIEQNITDETLGL